MFANLVESSSHKGDYARSGKFFLGTLTVYALAFLAIGVGSIYAYNAQIENKNLELISLVTPVEPSEVQPMQTRASSRPASGSNNSRVAIVRTPPAMVTTDARVAPRGTFVSPPITELPDGTIYKIGNPGAGANIFGGNGDRTGNSSGSNGSGGNSRMDDLMKDTPPPMKIETSKPPTPKLVISAGPINGKAIYLPKPAFTAIAKAAHASGSVNVEVLIDENGKVVSAHALGGHPLLLGESVKAAYQARFTPTLLGGQPVRVSGIITYNFVLQ